MGLLGDPWRRTEAAVSAASEAHRRGPHRVEVPKRVSSATADRTVEPSDFAVAMHHLTRHADHRRHERVELQPQQAGELAKRRGSWPRLRERPTPACRSRLLVQAQERRHDEVPQLLLPVLTPALLLGGLLPSPVAKSSGVIKSKPRTGTHNDQIILVPIITPAGASRPPYP